MALQLSQRLLGAAFSDHDEARRLRVLDLEVFFFGTAIAQTSIDRPAIIARTTPDSHRDTAADFCYNSRSDRADQRGSP